MKKTTTIRTLITAIKKLYVVFVCVAFYNQCCAQAFAGTTIGGGANSNGVIFKINADGSNYTNLHDFNVPDGVVPYAGIIKASDGLLYGMASEGGTADMGVIFRIATDGTGYTELYTFAQSSSTDGKTPFGTLIEHTNGKLYGMTSSGGTQQNGSIFQIDKDGSNYNLIHSFITADNCFLPTGSLIEASDQKLYGTCTQGGTTPGAIFKIESDGTGFSVLKDMTNLDGYYPYGDLIEASDGKLYGTTYLGGNLGTGTIYRMDKDGSNFSIIHHFTSLTGESTLSGLLEVGGMLFGNTRFGGANNYGVVFSCNLDGSNYQVEHDFQGVADGASPFGVLTVSSGGAIYGVTAFGGSNNGGTFFSVGGGSFNVLHHFQMTTGGQPYFVRLQEVPQTLPVTLSRFDATKKGDAIVLNWHTSSEENNLGFDIQRSHDGESWQTLYFQKGRGTTSEIQQYQYNDEAPLPGKNYYRLKQIDIDGQFDFSEMVLVDFENHIKASLQSNPVVNGKIVLQVETKQAEEARLQLINGSGEVINSSEHQLIKGYNEIEWSANSLPAGIYFIFMETKKFIYKEPVLVGMK